MSADWNRSSFGDGRPTPSEREEIARAVESVPSWWHSIELLPHLVTPGQTSAEWLEQQWQTLALGSLEGRSVLDVGAWDGYYSFAAERAGAERVVALDGPVWLREGGKAGFDLACKVFGSSVEGLLADLTQVDPNDLGTFDVVLFLGVLYHLKDPFDGLRRVAALTAGEALIETEAIVVPGYERSPLWRFYEDASLNDDPSNWWIPNEAALHALCRAAGFSGVETLARAHPTEAVPDELIGLGRLICRAWKR